MAWNITAMYAGMTLGSFMGGWIIITFEFVWLPVACSVFALSAGILSKKNKSR